MSHSEAPPPCATAAAREQRQPPSLHPGATVLTLVLHSPATRIDLGNDAQVEVTGRPLQLVVAPPHDVAGLFRGPLFEDQAANASSVTRDYDKTIIW